MCGIAGYFGQREISPDRLDTCLQRMKRRGPDSAAYRHWQNSQGNHVYLLHSRLSIIDLDPRSNQPFKEGSKWIAFNGELYNYLEVRSHLASQGETFKTESDTEVFIKAIDRSGWSILDRCEGMWALAVYDEKDGSLHLCRDRFGEKPLYLWQREEGLYFASEVKALAALAGTWPAIDNNHLIRYLVNGYKSLYKTKDTFFRQVEALPNATHLQISNGGTVVRKTYWSPKLGENERLSYDDAVSMTREAVVNAVRLRLRADVPLAFCMSGGIDSNTLISIASRLLDCDVHGFTIVNTDVRYEEQALVDRAVRELGIRHTPVTLQQQGFLDNLKTLTIAHDAPVYTISHYVHWQLMQAIAAEGYKIAIGGVGADELFTGYYDHHNLYLYEVARDRDLHQRSLAAWQSYQAGIVRNPFLKDPDLYLKDPTFRDHIYLNNDMFASWLHHPWGEPFTEIDYGVRLLRNRMMNELFAEAVPVILHEDDLNAMFFSIENRSPFLDRHLFEIAYSIPTPYLVKEGRAKAVLRDAMRGIVSDPILDNRRKVGFNAPILDLLDTKDPDVRAFLLDNSPIYDIIQKDKIENLLQQSSLPNSVSKFLFYFICAKMFLEYH